MKKLSAGLMVIIMTACLSMAADAKKASDGFEPAGQSGSKTSAVVSAAPAATASDVQAKTAADAKDLPQSCTPCGQQGEQKPQGKESKGLFDNSFIFILLGVMVLMIFLSSRSRKKQERQRKEMIEALKKGDKVVTIGGICGTIVEAKPTEIVIKVDDNTKIKFARWAVRAAGEDAAADKKKDTNDQQNASCNNNA
ncbi:MAG TPA: preprotein translocase subunit YajC [Phycisphaerae bacterium]|nr:preprotein translocase subunit YajC [Phycisphaerae bacterium]